MSDNGHKIRSPNDLTSLRDRLTAGAEGRRRVLVCSTGCLAIGAREVEAAFRAEVDAAGLQDEVEVVQTGCHGLCAMAPVAVIEPYDIVYGRNRVKYIPDVFSKTVMGGEIIRRFCYGRDPDMAHLGDIPFYTHQTKKVLRNVGINTVCSCGHKMYIECETRNATQEFDTIYAALREVGQPRFRVTVRWNVYTESRPISFLTVWLPKADGSFTNEDL